MYMQLLPWTNHLKIDRMRTGGQEIERINMDDQEIILGWEMKLVGKWKWVFVGNEIRAR